MGGPNRIYEVGRVLHFPHLETKRLLPVSIFLFIFSCYGQNSLPGRLESVIPGGRLGEFRFGTACVGYYAKDPVTGKNELVDILKEGDQELPTYTSKQSLVHAGTDIVPGEGLDIYPIADGHVIDIINDKNGQNWDSLGYMVIIQHDEKTNGKDTYSLYLHMNSVPDVVPLQQVYAGKTKLGSVGKTGAAFGVHLHIEVRHFKERFFPKWGNIYGKVASANYDSSDLQTYWENPETFQTSRVTENPEPSGVGPMVLNLHKDHDMNSEVVLSVSEGTVLRVDDPIAVPAGSLNGSQLIWWKLAGNSISGWAEMQMNASTVFEAAKDCPIEVTKDFLWFRGSTKAHGIFFVAVRDNILVQEPSSTSTKIRDLPVGTQITVTGATSQAEGRSWWKLNAPETGWAAVDRWGFKYPKD